MRLPLRVVAIAVASLAVNPPALSLPLPLAKLRNLNVELDARAKGALYVRMFTDEYAKGTTRTPGGRCQRPAPKVQARINGQPLARMTGVYAGGDLTYDRDCLLELAFAGPIVRETTGGAYGGRTPMPAGMQVAGPIPAKARTAGPASIRIDEGETHLALDIPDAFTPRRLTMESPPDGALRAGQPVTLRWQPATDDISKADVALRRVGDGGVGAWVTIPNKDLSIRGDRIAFKIPSVLPDHVHGDVEIMFMGTSTVKARFGPCPVDRCYGRRDLRRRAAAGAPALASAQVPRLSTNRPLCSSNVKASRSSMPVASHSARKVAYATAFAVVSTGCVTTSSTWTMSPRLRVPARARTPSQNT